MVNIAVHIHLISHRMNRLHFFTLFIFLISSSFTFSASTDISLNSNWYLRRAPEVTDEGNRISRVGYDGSNWILAIVPGTVLTSFEKAGLIENPYFGDNLEKLPQDYYNVDYWYRTEFQIPADYKGKRIWLNFDGINWKADIYLNDTQIGDLDGPFIRGRYDITEHAKTGGNNALAVRLQWCDAQPPNAPTFICSAGWDWMPSIPGRNLGVYKEVYLSASGDVTIADPFVTTDLPLPDTSSADIEVRVDVTNHTESTVHGTLTGAIEPLGITVSQPVTLKALEQKTVIFSKANFKEFVIKNPPLWWPNGYGPQNLNTLTLTFQVGQIISDTKEVRFGIREYSYDIKDAEIRLSVNGYPVMLKGGNWGMPEAMLKWKDKDFEAAVRLHRQMNFTMIRTWHGTSDFEAFYDACDKYGLMVFEEFWMNASTHLEMYTANARDKFKRLRNHACIAIWGNENNQIYSREPIYSILTDAYKELDGTRIFFHPSNFDAFAGRGPYAIQDPSWYIGSASGFTSEIGSPCVPSVESMRQMMDEANLWPIGDIWAWHDWDQDIGNKRPDLYVKEVNTRYGAVTGIEDFCRKAQMINLETYKAIFESRNQRLWDTCTGVLLWMSQSAWPSTIWQTYDYYFEGTGAYYGSKKACEPVHVQWNIHDGSVKAINLTRQDLKNVTVEAQAYNMDGSLRHTHILPNINLASNSSTYCFDFLRKTGNNLAFNKSAVASSEKEEVFEGHPAKSAVDQNTCSRWASEYSDSEWIYVDLGANYNIDTVVIEWEIAYGRSYEIQISNNAQNWTTVFTTETGDGGTDVIHFAPVDAQYVRMYGRNRGTYYGYSIHEFIVNETGSTPATIPGLSDVYFIKLRLKDVSGNILSDNFYWGGTQHLDYTALSQLKTVDLKCSVDSKKQAETALITATLTNDSDHIAFGVHLEMLSETSGRRILPAYYEDNYFSLLPSECKIVTIEFETSLLNGDNPLLTIDGWNINTQTVNIK